MSTLLKSRIAGLRKQLRRRQLRSNRPTAKSLLREVTQLEQLILLSASPFADLAGPQLDEPDEVLEQGLLNGLQGGLVQVVPAEEQPPVDDTDPDAGGDPGPGDETEAPAFEVRNVLDLSGEPGDHVEFVHNPSLELSEGTIGLNFTADNVFGKRTLFSKDFSGSREGGDLTAFVRDGRLEVRFQSASESVWLTTRSGSVRAGEDHHLALTFGGDGFQLYLDGVILDAESGFTQGLENNDRNLVLGANTWERSDSNPTWTGDHFDGRLENFAIYGRQFDMADVAQLAGRAPDPPLTDPTVIDGVLYGTDRTEVLNAALHNVNQVHGGYGDDTVLGTTANDTLMGGHGEDWVSAGAGDDWIASYADSREPVIVQNYTAEDDPDGEIDDQTRTLYPDQPIEADDAFVGGVGADTFYFRTLINAKRDIILKHVNDDGTINWGMNGVAGENNNVHDHWVEGVGNDVIWDFNRDQGDKILIEGHTTEVYRIVHQDSDGDNIIDSTVLHLWSNQGNGGGAHNKDRLGTITVFGDLITENDFVVNKHDYGFVATVFELEEALAPRVSTPYTGNDPPPTPTPNDGDLPDHGVFGVSGLVDFNGDEGSHLEIAHDPSLELSHGTIAFTFTADDIWGRQTLFSKDFSGNREGGDLTASVRDGRLEVRFQGPEGEIWLKSQEGSVQQGHEHHFAMTFGSDGAWLYLDGMMADREGEFTDGLAKNVQGLAIGANTWGRTAEHPYATWDHFDGKIDGFTVYDLQYDLNEVATLAGNPPDPPLTEPTVMDGVLYGTDRSEMLNLGDFAHDAASTSHEFEEVAVNMHEYLHDNHAGNTAAVAASHELEEAAAQLHRSLHRASDRRDVNRQLDDLSEAWESFLSAIATVPGDAQLEGMLTELTGLYRDLDQKAQLYIDVDEANGGYGDDTVLGTMGNDTLWGGHGEDWVSAGTGDDWIMSFADAREPVIVQNYTAEDDPDNEINDDTRTLYPNQPIEADDGFVGGMGADTFYFRTLINAKREIILKHVNDDGTINWGMNGVAGENNEVHDHWVDGVGHDVIWDFNRDQGDKILIEGHTTEVYKLVHQDSDGDGIVDSTVLHLWSNQGNGGGAHNKDRLGTITVFGDLITENDYIVNKHDYGFVKTISELDEALAPRVSTPYTGNDPPPMPTPNDGELPEHGVLGVNGAVDFSGGEGEHIEIAHDPSLQLSQGTVAFTFTADDIWGYHTLFSKDYSDNRDGGDLTAFVVDGRLKVRFQSADGEIWLTTDSGTVLQGQQHHFAMTFGDDGAWLYLDGVMQDREAEFTEGLQNNTVNLAVGANTWHRSASHPNSTSHHFDGQIQDFTIYGQQFAINDIAAMAGNPVAPPLTDPTVMDGTLYGTDADELLDADLHNVTQVHAGYGDDTVMGTAADDTLRGGHGEDSVVGGGGNDWLVSYADAREPVIAQNYTGEDDPDNEIDDDTRTLYPDQPIEADDVFVGGAGADTFYFRTLINAKREIILKHVNDDGTINWGMNGVAGENNNVHDHWVDGVGHEVIWDFNRADGDKILIEGHTTEVYKLVHQDSDGDNVIDSTVLHLWSNQGNGGGAHNKDRLGTITVFGDLVTENDFVVNKTDYGIVETIFELDEALTPRVSEPYTGNDPPPTPTPDDGELPDYGVLGVNGPVDLTGEEGDHIEIAHDPSLQLSQGTIAFTFTADDVLGRHALFSKDYSDNRGGGDLTATVRDGRLEVRFQNASGEIWLKSGNESIQQGQQYHFAMTFGDDGAWLYLDGVMQDREGEFTEGLQNNTVNMAIGAATWYRSDSQPYRTSDNFDGQIEGFTVFDQQFDINEVATLAGNPPAPPLTAPTIIDGVLYGTDRTETLNAAVHNVNHVHGGYGDDTVLGTTGADTLMGGHGEDWVSAGAGDDWIASYADAREPVIAQNYTAEDDPNNEINDPTRTLYPDQPIEADDGFVGGMGADTFYFRTLINAKREIILKHVNDDGTINWGMNGVAGENNNVHDHWVDGIGHDVIWDFNRDQGDKILIEGHTTEVYKVVHQDSDGDNIVDSTVLHLWSNQGNGGGAHNKDRLGTITVFGDLVTEGDYMVTKTDYGIVETIYELDEAITPRVSTPYTGNDPPPMPTPNDGDLPEHGVFGVNGSLDFSGECGDQVEIAHDPSMQLSQGTITLSFTADDIWGRHALFSKDYSGNRGGGDLTAFVNDGRVEVRFQSADGEVWLKSQQGSVEKGQEYHFAMTFGDDGAWLYLNGRMQDWETEFTQGLDNNTVDMAIGANTWGRNAEHPDATWDHFDGQIEGFTIYDAQYDRHEVALMAGNPPDPPLSVPTVIEGVLYGTDRSEMLNLGAFAQDAASASHEFEEVAAEVHEFLHDNHAGSGAAVSLAHELEEVAADLHHSLHRAMDRRDISRQLEDLARVFGSFQTEVAAVPGDAQLEALLTELGNNYGELEAKAQLYIYIDEANGGYGDDTVLGTMGNDVVQGGHGEDWVSAGSGDDWLVSYADAREPVIAQNYTAEDDPDNELNDATRTLYPNQPIEADDGFVGGLGADTFYFRTLINAKRDIILKHVNDDGTINWGMNGVAGENDNVHDHWVDGIGHDVIWDFNRDQGDKILIEGHTTEVYKMVHQDSDGDNIIDSTVLHLWSNQGNGGGAHNKDLLGTITVFGDLVTESDFTVNKHDYGFVATIDELDEALAPRVSTPYTGNDPPLMPTPNDGDLPEHGVLGVRGAVDFTGDEGDHLEVAHDPSLQLSQGTIAFNFTADDIWGYKTLFSKDYSDNRDGGDLTAFVYDGRLKVRFQSADGEIWLSTEPGSIQQGRDHHFAMTFGDDGAWLYLDGVMQDREAEFTDGLENNTVNMAIGANTWHRNASRPYETWNHFDGRIEDFTIYDVQKGINDVATLAGNPPAPPLTTPTVMDGVLYGTDRTETLNAAVHGVNVVDGGYGDDTVLGTTGADVLKGGHGEDWVSAGAGDDWLISFADAREPVIAQNYTAEDDPDNEINNGTRTLYPNQPIEADDAFVGGVGADTFYFRTLINAKREIILKHVNSDGTINWGMNGVAGENNNVHDHWVDGVGHDVIWDFSRDQGDKILIEGHTTEVYKLVHQDSDGDNIIDSTVLHLWSNQGNGGGAHNKDLLGTITVFGDLVTEDDYVVNKHDYGFVETIFELDEALAPRVSTPYTGNDPPPMPTPSDGDLPQNGVFGVNGEVEFSGEGHVEIAHDPNLQLTDGTIALAFTADDVWGRHALFSKDFTGNRDGGDLTAFVQDGRVEVRFQNAAGEIWLKTHSGSIVAGQKYHLALTFGDEGAALYLNGNLAAWNTQFTDGLENNTQNMAIGATTWSRTESNPYKTGDNFDGRIEDFTIYDLQMDAGAVASLASDENGLGEENPGNAVDDPDAAAPLLGTPLGNLARAIVGTLAG